MGDVEKTTPPGPPEPATPPTPPPEPVDEAGVPYKNRLAEMKRKLEEQENLNLRYQQALGELSQARAVAPSQPERKTLNQSGGVYKYTHDGQEYEFDAPSVALIRSLADEISRQNAEQTAYRLITKAQLTQEIQSDQELQKVANEEFSNLSGNPLFASLPQEVKEAMAISNAKNRLLQARLDAAKKGATSQTLQEAAAAQAAAASLPSTQPGGQPTPDREKYIRDFINDPEQRGYCKKMWKLDPDSAEGQAKLKSVAEYAWKGSPVSEKFAQTFEIVKRGGQ